MKRGNEASAGTHDQGLREVPRLAGVYSRNRTLVILVSMLICSLAAALIAGLSAGAARAYGTGHPGLGVVLMVADAVVCLGWVWLVLSKRLNQWMSGVSEWLYRGDGMVVAAPVCQPGRSTKVVAWVFGVLVCATPMLLQQWPVPDWCLQPITALYTVPFMAWLWWAQRSHQSPLMLIWPVLYALHAVALLAGLPLLRTLDPMMQVLLPMVAYSAIAVVASHLHGRYALRRLRALARAGAEDDGPEGGES
jgi:hypothetical protein